VYAPKVQLLQLAWQAASNRLLQLPGPALHLVLQKLDQRSSACTAVTCSKLSHAVPAAVSKAVMLRRLEDEEKVVSFKTWVQRQNTSLVNFKQCRLALSVCQPPHIRSLPRCLEQLYLHSVHEQLEPADGCPGLLQDCTALTSLELRYCTVQDVSAAAAAVAEATQLWSLRLSRNDGEQDALLLPDLQHLLQLTRLELEYSYGAAVPEESIQMSALSGLVGLQHIILRNAHQQALPDGLPSQLTKLTCLDMSYNSDSACDGVQQLQHLSSLTALQQLSVSVPWRPHDIPLTTGAFWGAQHLSQLTALKLCPAFEFSPNSTKSWSRLTALHSLSLHGCTVQPGVLSKLQQLQALSHLLCSGACPAEVLAEIAQLSALTELDYIAGYIGEDDVPPAAAAFTALTASTNLCSLELGQHIGIQACDLFMAGKVYPHLRRVNLTRGELGMPLSEQQLQQLCCCCPALDSLTFRIFENPSSTALLPLQQLPALTHLALHRVGATAAVVAGAVARLTGLKVLHVVDLSNLTDPTLLQLTALTALEELHLDTSYGDYYCCHDEVSGQ
jgi:hypothetical protein